MVHVEYHFHSIEQFLCCGVLLLCQYRKCLAKVESPFRNPPASQPGIAQREIFASLHHYTTHNCMQTVCYAPSLTPPHHVAQVQHIILYGNFIFLSDSVELNVLIALLKIAHDNPGTTIHHQWGI